VNEVEGKWKNAEDASKKILEEIPEACAYAQFQLDSNLLRSEITSYQGFIEGYRKWLDAAPKASSPTVQADQIRVRSDSALATSLSSLK